ncbi:MAG: hypothetical protein COA33_006030 [Fluviicola sp.]|nr:hypothetical protein [Fluviicola sp.]
MKKTTLIFTIAFGSLMVSCSGETNIEKGNSKQEKELPTSKVNELTLDNGEKWESNAETYQGMTELRTLLENFNGETLEDYHLLGDKSNEQTAFIISNCSMKGAAHDQLHFVLLPILENKDNLISAETIESAEIEFSKLDENVESFFTFFKN